MARSSGTYSLPAGQPVVNGTVIDATVFNTLTTDIANELTNSLPRDGTAPPTANLPMGNFKITGLANGTVATDAAAFGQIPTSYNATAIVNTPAGNIAATTVQAALNELDAEKAKIGANSDITSLTGLTTPLSVAQGGVGANTHTLNSLLLGNGTSALLEVAPSTSGNLLTSNGTTWQSATPTAQLVKAWVNYNGVTSSLLANFNISSVTKNGTGDYTFNITSALVDANYATTANPFLASFTSATAAHGIGIISQTTSAVRVVNLNGSGSAQDVTVTLAIFR